MSERVKVTTKAPEAKRENPVSQTRQPESSQSMDSLVDRILHLQRTIGNQAVQRMMKSVTLQAKLRIGQPHDKHEQEADRVADQVMRMPDIQRSPGCVSCGETEEAEPIRTKQISEQITPLVQRQVESEEEEEEPIQAKVVDGVQVQRQEEEPEEEEEGSLLTKGISGRIPRIGGDLDSRLNRSGGDGQPLPEADRNFMERRFGVGFSAVRTHTDSNAVQMSRELNAQAFTHGRDIYFGAGRYSPGTSSSKRLLAHELTHVLQQHRYAPPGHFRANCVVQRQYAFTTFTPRSVRRGIPLYRAVTGGQTIGNLRRGRRVRILSLGTSRHRVQVMAGPLRNQEGYIRVQELIIPTATRLPSLRPVRLVFFQNPERIGTTVLAIGVGRTRRATWFYERTQGGRFGLPPSSRRCRVPAGRSVYLHRGPHPTGYYHAWWQRNSRRCEGYIPRNRLRTDISHRRRERRYYMDLGLRYASSHSSIFVDPISQRCMDRRYPVEYFSGRDILRGLLAAHNCTGTLVSEIHIVSHGGTHGIPGTGDFQHMYGIYLRNRASQVTQGGLTTRQFARQARRLLHNNVRIVIHACHTAESGGFAQELATELRNVRLTGAEVRGLRGVGPAGRPGPFYAYPGGTRIRN